MLCPKCGQYEVEVFRRLVEYSPRIGHCVKCDLVKIRRFVELTPLEERMERMKRITTTHSRPKVGMTNIDQVLAKLAINEKIRNLKEATARRKKDL